jgi:hypothetical protein
MIRVLVIANESLLADSIVSSLSQEADMEVFRRARDELGFRKDYSVVVIVDDGLPESESIKLKEVIRDNKTLLLVRVSLESRIVRVDESYEVVNPGMEQIISLVRDFTSQNLARMAQKNAGQQKKMNEFGDMHVREYNRQNTNTPVKNFLTNAQATDPEGQASIRVNRRPLLLEAWNSLTSLSLYQLRRTNSRSVTLPNRNRLPTGRDKV